MTNEEAIKIIELYPDIVISSCEMVDYKTACDMAIKALKAWDEIKKSGMPTLIIEDCAYILDKGSIDALIKYSEEQNKKELEEFGKFLKEVMKNESK